MTSCDDTLAPYTAITLTSMSHSLSNAQIDFFLLHSRISNQNLELLYALCETYPNIHFHPILIPDQEPFSLLAKYGGWTEEAYYPACSHMFLPKSAERVLYLDAGDTLVVGDISPYYTLDFQNNALIATGSSYKLEGERLIPYTLDDLGDWENGLPYILRGLFNSGSYMLNLEKLRESELALDDFCYLAEEVNKIVAGDTQKRAYWGDQGLFSAAFVGNIRYYDFEQVQNVWHMPYNFCLWYFDRMQERPNYDPAIIHFAGAPKPWTASYLLPVKRFQTKPASCSLKELKFGQAEYYYLWHEYALMTDQRLNRLSIC
ncbi:MAG: hypothetical protein HFI63_00705 [Lachnospiraceae bacterium]|nr:hypothetical protein [Lachnospiraceae bacterium]